MNRPYGLNYLNIRIDLEDGITGQCSYCAKDIGVSNMGESALKSHAGSKKRQPRSPTEPNNSLSFFDRGKNEKNKEMSANSEKRQKGK